jgi:hypothetical protein
MIKCNQLVYEYITKKVVEHNQLLYMHLKNGEVDNFNLMKRIISYFDFYVKQQVVTFCFVKKVK